MKGKTTIGFMASWCMGTRVVARARWRRGRVLLKGKQISIDFHCFANRTEHTCIPIHEY